MKMFDTIAAIATPLGSGGVAIIRVSGAASYKVRSTELIAARYMMESHPMFFHRSMENKIR